jgi:hypothetical protein
MNSVETCCILRLCSSNIIETPASETSRAATAAEWWRLCRFRRRRRLLFAKSLSQLCRAESKSNQSECSTRVLQSISAQI